MRVSHSRAVLAFLLAGAVCVDARALRKLGPPTPDERAKATLSQMTLEEKLSLVHGTQKGMYPLPGIYAGVTPAIERLGVPALHLQDGPQGVGDGVTQVTAFPSALSVAATWNVSAMQEYAAAMAKEQRLKGSNVMLAPMVNLARVPTAGRNYESFGEDPFLSSELARASVRGIQSQGVIGCVKHWVVNDQENDRFTVDTHVSERTLWELHYAPFQAAIDEGVGSAMCSYNKVNGYYACENHQTLTVDLKERMGFKGWVMSDWGATHSTVGSANAGLDQEMPDSTYFGDALRNAVNDQAVPQSRVDDMALRILRSIYAAGLADTPQTGSLTSPATSPEHAALARRLASESATLVKNNKAFLPLQLDKLKSVAIIGPAANDTLSVIGKGSGEVTQPYVITPLEALRTRLEKSGVKVLYSNGNDVGIAAQADVALVIVGFRSGEGWDRENLKMGWGQDEMIGAVAGVQPRTAVIVHSPGGLLMPWADAVQAVLIVWLPGQEDGHAIESVVFGDVNPSGRLPLSFPKSDEETWLKTKEQYPGVDHKQVYSEELLMGYRYYNAKGLEPLYPFGHGLSYTTFKYDNLKASKSADGGVSVSVEVSNAGDRAGADVPQLYVTFPEAANEPPVQLKGFHKTAVLAPGAKESVTFSVPPKLLSVWSEAKHEWEAVHGTFSLAVGASSKDLKLHQDVTI